LFTAELLIKVLFEESEIRKPSSMLPIAVLLIKEKLLEEKRDKPKVLKIAILSRTVRLKLEIASNPIVVFDKY
jgi:hypothetical protein